MKVSEAKVAWITPVLGREGNLLYMGPLLRAFSKRCGQFRVLTAEYSGDLSAVGFEIERCGFYYGFYKNHYRNERFTAQGHLSYMTGFSIIGPAVIGRLKDYRPDLMILNEFGLQTLYGILYAKCFRRGTKVLLLVETKPRSLGGMWLTRIKILFRRLLVKAVNVVLTNNEEGRQYLTEVLGVSSNMILSRPYLISDMSAPMAGQDRNLRRRQQFHEKPIRFLYVGQLLQLKGLQYALGACAKLLSTHEGRFVYEIVGDGPYRAELEEMTHSLGLVNHVFFRGRQPYEKLGQFYAEADVFVFPTLGDYRALVPFEAMSLGLPILASVHDGGVAETVSHGENGFAFDPYDTQRLAELMAYFIENPGAVSAFSMKSLEKAASYTLSSAIDALVEASELALEGQARK